MARAALRPTRGDTPRRSSDRPTHIVQRSVPCDEPSSQQRKQSAYEARSASSARDVLQSAHANAHMEVTPGWVAHEVRTAHGPLWLMHTLLTIVVAAAQAWRRAHSASAGSRVLQPGKATEGDDGQV